MNSYTLHRRIFSSTTKDAAEDPNLYSGFESEIVSSIPMQMIIYFNAIYFPVWFTMSVVSFIVKFKYLEQLYQFITIAVFVTMPVVEIIRLYFAYEGNMREKVPDLGGSWLLTILIQLPLLLFLLFVPGNLQLPLETSIHPIFLIFLIAHVIEGFRTMRNIAWHQAQRLYLYSSDQ